MRRRSRASSKPTKARRHRAKSPKGSAIEVAQLRRELDEAREQQAATADVLKSISRSTFDLKAVLNTLAESAAAVCEALNATIYLRDEDFAIIGAHFGPLGGKPIGTRVALNINWLSGRAVLEARTIHVADLSKSDEYPEGKELAQRFGHRTTLTVPLLRDQKAIGGICVRRREVRPFTDKQIAQVQNFAAQAVIAIENTRLLNELRRRTTDLTESLEQQTATSEVLKVISSSQGELEPVFEATLEKAVRICEAKFGNVYRWDGDALSLVASHNTPLSLIENRRRAPFRPSRKTPFGRVLSEQKTVHVVDAAAEEAYIERSPSIVAAVELGGIRTYVAVPMLKGDQLIGIVSIFRQEVFPFTEKQVSLLENFATQAVIAIENARLLGELRQSLELQTATADVLRVISSSPNDLRPVLDALAENAARLCDAFDVYIQLREGNMVRYVAHYGGIIPTSPVVGGTRPLTRDLVIGRAMLESRPIHVLDLQTESEEFPEGSAIARRAGYRTIIAVPLMRQGYAIGTIAVRRVEARLFSDKEVELLSNFAAEAVIAIENARLLTELRERTADLSESLEQQKATFDVLKVISSTPGELE